MILGHAFCRYKISCHLGCIHSQVGMIHSKMKLHLHVTLACLQFYAAVVCSTQIHIIVCIVGGVLEFSFNLKYQTCATNFRIIRPLVT